MFFIDSLGFFSLMSLAMQAIMAGIFAAFFLVRGSSRGPWSGRLRAAFIALAVALIAIAARFIAASQNLADKSHLEEGELLPRLAYGVYFAGKMAFLWLLVGAVAGLRDRRWPAFRAWHGLVLAVLFGTGSMLPSVEAALLLQAPFVVAAFLGASRLLWPRRSARTDLGHRSVAMVLFVWGLFWVLYAVAVVGIWLQDVEQSFFNGLLQLNAFIDLCMQVMLGIGLVVMMMDGTHQRMVAALHERDELRDRLERGEKLRALSTLVSGVAHEINNPLTAILGYADELAVDDPELRAEAASIVREQAHRCRHIVQRLSVLSPSRTPRRTNVAVNELIDAVARGLAPQFRAAGVALQLEPGPPRLRIHAEDAAVEQVLTNLLINALHVSRPGQVVAVRLRIAADQVAFVVEDQGGGVTPENRERIFEPFFTTKQGAGTGLGLAVARAIVESHGGEIAIEDGRAGARFVVTLPQAKADAAAPEPAGEEAFEIPRVASNSRLLVIDDEPLVRRTVARHARNIGWHVDEAESGEMALRMLQQDGLEFDAVICDLRMPGMSGIELHDSLAITAPEIVDCFVFVTGDLASDEAAQFARRTHAPIFTKPLSFSELLGAVHARARSRARSRADGDVDVRS